MRKTIAVLLVLLLPLLMAASFRTANFVCSAPTVEIAKACAECAEQSRKRIAVQWLGRELDPWREPTPLKVTITQSSGGGASSFGFGGRTIPMSAHVEGRLDKLLSSVIPHETCHMCFATFFQAPTPRCFDEGAAVTCEDPEELARQDRLCREILNTPGRAMPLKRLFSLREYPSDVAVLYAQGFSVTSYLIGLRGRSEFLQFVWHGQQRGWDEAVRVCYGPHFQGLDDVNSLERAWLAHMKATKPGTAVPVASAPAVKTYPGDLSMVRDTGAPRTGTISPSDTAAIFQALAEGQRMNAANTARLIENDRKQDAEIREIKERLDRLEWNTPRQATQGTPHPSGGTISDIPGWKPPAVRQQPARQPVYAQPYASPASIQPYCPPGGT